MTKESLLRKCSHCGHNGHNSRTCNNVKGCSFKLFGVRIDPNPHQIHNHNHGKEKENHKNNQFVNGIGESIRKCKSMGNLQAFSSNNNDPNSMDHGYLSDGLLDQSKDTNDTKKGMPWTEEEHRSFLIGLKKLGKGDWRGISKNYVTTRTPTQVASHAQKYFIRMNTMHDKRKKRSSVFDMPFEDSLAFLQNSTSTSTSTTTSSALPTNEPSNVSLQLGISPVDSVKTSTSNIQRQPKTPAAPVAASIRPPIPPMAQTYGIQDFNWMPYMGGYPRSNGDSFGDAKCLPTISFVPVVNYPNQGRVFPVNCHRYGSFTGGSSSPMAQSSASLLGAPQPELKTPVTKKDVLEASVGALSL